MLHFRRIAMGASKPAAPDFTDNYLTIEALEDEMTVSLSKNACEYCIDGSGDWIALPASTTTPSVNTGQTLSFRASHSVADATDGIGTFSISKKCKLKGNIMSILYKDDVEDKPLFAYCFKKLFENATNIIEVSKDFCPAKVVKYASYWGTFKGCSSLITAPDLPADYVGDRVDYAFYETFRGCASLVNAPSALKIFGEWTCYNMFYGCRNLEIAPEITFVSLYGSMCYGMFQYCNNLRYIKVHSNQDISSSYLSGWMKGVAANGVFAKPIGITFPTGTSGIPDGWTVEEF